MRFHLNDARRHRQAAKALTRAMRANGIEMGLTGGLDWAARLYGYSDRHELDACLGKGPPGLWDEDESPGVVAARRERQLAVLAHAGVAPDLRAGILDAVRPTSRKPSSSAKVTATSRENQDGAAGGPPRPAGNAFDILDVLDEWDRSIQAMPRERFEELVLEAYARHCRSIRVNVDRQRSSEMITGYCAGSAVLLNMTKPELGVWDWLNLTRHGEVIEVPHPDGVIPVTVMHTGERAGVSSYACNLLRNLAPSPKGLAELGLQDWEDWDAVLRSRIGLHVICADRPHVVLIDALLTRLDAFCIQGAVRECSAPTLNMLQDEVFSPRVPDVDFVRGHGVVRGAPVGVVIIDSEQDSYASFDRIMTLALRTGRSVILLASTVGPRDLIRKMLMQGVESDYLRAVLLSTGECRIVGGKPFWAMELCS